MEGSGDAPALDAGSKTSRPMSDLALRAAMISDKSEFSGEVPGFNVIETYNRFISEDPDATMSLAAIEALIELLGATGDNTTTFMETLKIIQHQTDKLCRNVPNPIAVGGGCQLFQQYLMRALKQQPQNRTGDGKGARPMGMSPVLTGPHDSFEEAKLHLIRNGRVFAARAKSARDQIANLGHRYIHHGDVVLAAGGSRTVKRLLLRAADAHIEDSGAPRFKVVYVMDGSADSAPAVQELRERGIPTAEIAPDAVAHALEQVKKCFIGAEVVTQNGGLLSRMGTLMIAELAKARKKPVYVAAETHKIARVYPLSQQRLPLLGLNKGAVDFRSNSDSPVNDGACNTSPDHFVDYTPPEFVNALITEHGVKLPSAIFAYVREFQ